jgi:polyisoprenoid-binding protein YceI
LKQKTTTFEGEHRMRITAGMLAAAFVIASASGAAAGTWTIDTAHSAAHFSVRHMMVSTVRGSFAKVEGTVELNEQDITQSVVQATIDVASINTGVEARDKHLRSADFFDVEKYPTITFRSTGSSKQADGRLKAVGDLTLHGVTREVTLDVEPLSEVVPDGRGGRRTGTSANGRINRKDFGLTWNRVLETGGLAVGEEVAITIDIQLVQKTAGK